MEERLLIGLMISKLSKTNYNQASSNGQKLINYLGAEKITLYGTFFSSRDHTSIKCRSSCGDKTIASH